MEKKNRILIVDDAEMNRSLLADILSVEYDILEAANGVEAVSLLNKYHTDISLVLLDIVMPQMDGFEVLTIMNKSKWIQNIPVIMISAETSSGYIDHAYDLGATEYISRPFDERTVLHRVKNTIMLYTKQKNLESMVTEQILEKEKNNFLMVEILSNIVEFRNGESGLHILHIRVITEMLLKKLMEKSTQYRMSSTQLALIVNASALHDIGKISIPEHILNKPGRLTAEEFEIMKTHSAIGAQILENAPNSQKEELIRVAHDICRWHHERYDGKGYPDGLTGDKIPISAQVVSLADVYDALTSKRVYKAAYTHEQAMELILNGECGAFNPLLLECLVEAGDHIAEEVKIRSLGGMTHTEIQSIAAELMSNNELKASSRTLALLEQERIKYRFFASMSHEVQFEYNRDSDLLEISEWGARYLGLPELIAHPEQSKELSYVFHQADYQKLQAALRKATRDNPVISGSYCLTVQGKPRWFKVVVRTLWDGEDQTSYTTFIGKFIDIHEEQMELASLKQLASQDSLTALYNHKAARAAIEAKIEKNRDRSFALILFDVDYFKGANDLYGHIFGDEVLKYVAQKMRQNIRQDDVAARVGGDEFLIFAEYKQNLYSQIQRIFDALSDHYQKFQISISMGVALCPDNGWEYESLFHCADQALYSAKKSGRNQYCMYDKSIRGFLSVLSPMDN